MIIISFLLVLMVGAALWAVAARNLIKAAIGLAFVSVVLTMVLFRLGCPVAAVFELSVCAGLITVIFISTISLTNPLSAPEFSEMSKELVKRFWALPVVLIIIGIYMFTKPFVMNFNILPIDYTQNFKTILWIFRRFDILGQIIAILAGVFGIIVLLKEEQ